MNKAGYRLTVFFGDADICLEKAATAHDPDAKAVDQRNHKQFVQQTLTNHTTVFSSLEHLSLDLDTALTLLLLADTIVYCPPAHWSDGRVVDWLEPDQSLQGLTEFLLHMISDRVPVENLGTGMLDPNPLVDHRKSQSTQLWLAGCSITHGQGVSQSQRYGQLLADELGLPCSFLTRPGSAINWAADQLLRSDLRQGDRVIWGLTNPERLTWFDSHRLLPGISTYTYSLYPEIDRVVPLSNLYSHNTIYQHLYAIKQVINFCNKCGAMLILFGVKFGSGALLPFLRQQKNYVQFPYKLKVDKNIISPEFFDLGNDNQHPGPQQHEQYKTFLSKYIKIGNTTDSV